MYVTENVLILDNMYVTDKMSNLDNVYVTKYNFFIIYMCMFQTKRQIYIIYTLSGQCMR